MSGYRKFNFPAAARIKRRADFGKIQKDHIKGYSKHFLVLMQQTNLARSRLGVTVTTKIDKRATVRNRIKRLIREAFRLIQYDFVMPYDIVVIARNGSTQLTAQEVAREIRGVLRFHKIL